MRERKVVEEARAASRKMEGTEDAIPDDREDLRETLICTIDPPNAKDYDDAIGIRPRDGGGFHVSVHIADVGHYVRPGTSLDDEALARGDVLGLAQRRHDLGR